jgi:type I restriction-modification system DNA methylase subunit
VEKLHKNNRLFLLIGKFSSVDLHPDVVDNHTMGQIFEELLRKFSEMSNEAQNPNGRFFAGTPRTSDGSLLFLQHMISKMEEKGSRIGIVFNGFPLFTGDAGSGESEIRRWMFRPSPILTSGVFYFN